MHDDSDLDALRRRLADAGQHENTREAAISSLDAVLDYLRTAGVPLDDYRPLKTALGALDDLNNGRRNEFFDVDKFSNQAPMEDDLDMALASAVVTLYNKQGVSLKDAADIVVRFFPGRLRRNIKSEKNDTLLRDSLLNYRRELINHRKKNDDLINFYKRMIEKHDDAGRLLSVMEKTIRRRK